MKSASSKKQVNRGAEVLIVGAGEAFDADLGNTSYLLRGSECPTVLFDCGYQVPERLWKKGLHRDLDAICFTHLHADHSFGIVPMLVRFWEEGRSEPLHILGPRGTERYIGKLLELGYPGFSKRIQFPIVHHTLSLGEAVSFRGAEFTVAPTVHSVLNYTVRVDLKTPKGPRSFAVSGDGQITDASKALVHDVDCLFQEVYSETPGIPVHADLETVVKWASNTQIKHVVTSHFARSARTTLSKKLGARKSKAPRWSVARPQAVVRL
jgi:ribonuclease Z